MKFIFLIYFILFLPFSLCLSNEPSADPKKSPYTIEQLNKMNPFSDDFKIKEQTLKWIEDPYMKKIFSLFSSSEFVNFAKKIAENPDKKKISIYFLIFNIALFVLRWLLIANQSTFLGRIWTSLWSFVFIFICTFLVFPYYYFGKEYKDVLIKIYDVLWVGNI